MSTPPPPTTHCQKCGALLDQQLLGGACPSCLWSGLLEDDDAVNDRPQIPDHEIFEEIGHGGMGIVYRARQLKPDREVALKIIAPYSLRAAEARQRFLMEVEAMAAVEHPAVLPLYEIGEDHSGRPWLTMPLMDGGSLADISEKYAGKWREAALLIETLARAIGFAHERGIIHRDLKPSNILFDGSNHPYIADFGLAKWAHAESGVTQSNYLLGSPAYLAPEAAAKGSKATTTVSDVYGLGAILYELLTGTKPYDGGSAAEILTRIINEPPPSPRKFSAKLPRDLEVIVLKAMSRDPGKRYHSANALADDIGHWLDGRPILARPVGPLERALGWARRNPALATVSLLLLASIITAGILQSRANRDLTTALNDSEDRIDFMTRELPDAIEPLGRLEVLDNTFIDVAEHFELNPRKDPETLARHADFLGRWAQILRPRGLTIEAVARLRQSHQKAFEATEGEKNPSLAMIRSRLAAGLYLGEALHEEGGIDEARRVLDDTASYGEKFISKYPDDLELKISRAKITMEFVISDLENDDPEAALRSSKKAQGQWAEIKKVLLSNSSNDKNKTILAESARFFYFEAEIFRKIGDSNSRMTALREFQIQADDLRKRFPDNLHLRSESVVARTKLAAGYLDTNIGDPHKIRKLLEEADPEGKLLAASDPGNIRWALDSIFSALRLALLAEKRNDEEFTKWRNIVGERMVPLYQIYTTHLELLWAKRTASVFAIEGRKERDWPIERPHYLGMIQVQREIAAIQTTTLAVFNLQSMVERTAWEIRQYESQEATISYLKNLIEKLEKNPGTTLEKQHLWNWGRAAIYDRLATYQHETPAERKISLTRSREILLSSLPATRLFFHGASDHSTLPFSLITNLLKAGASDAPRKSNEEWTALMLELTPLLSEDEQKEISTLISDLLPATDPRFQSLKPLLKP